MAEYKLDIFRVLKAVDEQDREFVNNLTEEEIKALQPFLVARWLSGTYNTRQIIFINEIANPYLFSLYTHKELLWYLLTICTSGKSQRYTWNKTVSNKSAKPIVTQVIQEYFHYNRKDAEQVVALLSPEDIILMAEELGWQDDETNKIRKELGLSLIKTSKPKKKSIKITDPEEFEW